MHLIKITTNGDKEGAGYEIDELGLLCPAGKHLRCWLEEARRRLNSAEGFLVFDRDDENSLDQEVFALLVEGPLSADIRTCILTDTVCSQRLHAKREVVHAYATYFVIPQDKAFADFAKGKREHPLAFHINSKASA